MIVKILKDYGAGEGWKTGDIVEISNAEKLIIEGKVEPHTAKEIKVEEPKGEITPVAAKTKRAKKVKVIE